MLALLTVGTGTAGRSSNLASGLRTTLTQLAPRRFWLAPSAHEDSRATADLVREGFAGFAPASAPDPYFTLADPDDLEGCRHGLRSALAALRRELRPGEQLVVNPTSGTKQMTAAAVLAALDEGVGEIVFTVGQRADGVVVTGTERLTAFDPAGYFREHDLATARNLFAAGAFFAAARVLREHRAALPRAHATALACHHWQRLDYAAATAAAASGREDLRSELSRRAQLAATGTPSLEILADLLAWSGHAVRTDDPELALATAYKALEYAARLAFHARTGLVLPCAHRELASLPLSPDWLGRAAATQRDDGTVAPGLTQLMHALRELGHALGERFLDDRRLRDLTLARNAATHDIRPIAPAEARATLDRVRNLLAATLPPLPAVTIPEDLPAG